MCTRSLLVNCLFCVLYLEETWRTVEMVLSLTALRVEVAVIVVRLWWLWWLIRKRESWSSWSR